MTQQQAAEWKQDRQRRVAEMKARLLALPELTEGEKQSADEFGALIVKAKAYRDRKGWGEVG